MTAGQMVAVIGNQEKNRSRMPAWFRRREPIILGLTGIVGVLVIWQASAQIVGMDFTFFFSSPIAIAGEIGRAHV